MRILLAGGGSGGSAVPVLAVAEELRRLQPDVQLLYVGTREGPESQLVHEAGIPFVAVKTGKFRRYLSGRNLVDAFRVPMGVLQGFTIARHFRPDVAFGAGGYASVPPLLAAGVSRIPVLIHQQDVQPSLANRILAPVATRITVTFPDSVKYFRESKTAFAGNPVRAQILRGSLDKAREMLGLQPDVPVLLVTGGGTGALAINELVVEAVPALTDVCQIVHLTGRGREVPGPTDNPRYHQVAFLTGGMADVLAAASLVISRAGLSTLTEISALGKPSILIPMPGSHQEANARVYAERDAALVLDQGDLTAGMLANLVTRLLGDPSRLAAMGEKALSLYAPDASTRIARELLAIARK